MNDLTFDPKKVTLFLYAKLVYQYSRPPLLIIRLLFVTIFISSVILLSLEVNPRQSGYLITSTLSSLAIMFEIFYHFKVKKMLPESILSHEKTAPLNLASVVSLETALALFKADNSYQLAKNLLATPMGRTVIFRADLDPNSLIKKITSLEKNDQEFTTVEQLLGKALTSAQALGHDYINDNDLLIAFFTLLPTLSKELFAAEEKITDLINIVYWEESSRTANKKPFFEMEPTLGFAASWSAGYTLTLESLARNLSNEVASHAFASAFIGREQEIRELETVLSRTTKRNVLLVGDPGVGKSSLVKGLILRALEGESTNLISFKRFFELNVTSLLSGVQNAGDLEERLKNILNEMSNSNVILVIPQLQNLTGSIGSGNFDISGVLEPYLKSGDLQVVATANQAEFRRDIEPKTAFLDDFEVIKIAEPSKEETIRVIEKVAPLYEKRYQTLISYKALLKIIELGDKVEPDRLFPGKAITILDEILAYNSLQGFKRLEAGQVLDFLQTRTKIPLKKATLEESRKLLDLEKTLKKRVIGQEAALQSLALAVQRSRTLVKDPDRPIGVFLFLGPTGVGKTETAKALAEAYFGSEKEIVRLDMSEYQEQISVEKLIGVPQIPDSGQLTTKIRENPYTLLLLDELEKAHPQVLDLFLQVFDEGRLTDGSGRLVRFNNTLIIATSNAGSELIREKLAENVDPTIIKPLLLDFLQRQGIFRPEFLNRFGEVIIYQPLKTEQIAQITLLQLNYLEDRLKKDELDLVISPQALKKLAELGYDPAYGARALQRVIQEKIENPISTMLLKNPPKRGSKIAIDLDATGNFQLNS